MHIGYCYTLLTSHIDANKHEFCPCACHKVVTFTHMDRTILKNQLEGFLLAFARKVMDREFDHEYWDSALDEASTNLIDIFDGKKGF